MPATEIAASDNRNGQSIVIEVKEPKNPSKVLNAMITMEVAIAVFMVNRPMWTTAGTMTKPPPAPIKPVIKPPTSPNMERKYIG